MSANGKILHILINPASGAKKTEEIYKEEVLPFIKQNSPEAQIQEYKTEREGHATEIIRDLLNSNNNNKSLDLILLGGDGTTHEVVNGLIHQEGEIRAHPARLAIVPTGTANALYASLYAKRYGESFQDDKLRSVRSLLQGNKSETYPLALSLVQTKSKEQDKNFVAHLITSHALHASILADSESLRDQYPGIERFKVAFGKNMSVWVPASIELKPLANGKLQRYDPQIGKFIDIDSKEGQIEDLILYFAAVTTDRLEPAFVPAPFSGPVSDNAQLSRPSDAVDIVIYRPLQSPRLAKSQDAGQDFWLGSQSQDKREEVGKTNLVKISGLMYQEGKHVELTYKEDDNDQDGIEEKGAGPAVIEYYRCGGYTWTPKDANARRTCIDGTVIEADQTELRILSKKEGAGNIVICR
ncbi:uncharacterized protein FA14DRAFT_190502 [Meira miltonrushii]|uniref:DAGKc domain-containing protein n=1 Tax=Meira miltonrushii TaxID=1280837 RepID=A0A316V762_9BASI|nr:uncharacterized protein FA14DRAFT_190502 [Meira miltonrushii]PWN33340.1 hypothetical protein FA14DRAFT_190502 [Meira miltonrushii]